MQRYTAVKRSVRDHDGSLLCSCRDAATARLITDVLNCSEDARRRGPHSLMIRPHRMKGARIEWPRAPLNDIPRTELLSLRRKVDRRLAQLKRLFAFDASD